MTDLAEMIRLRMIVNQTFKGGEGSGNFGHAGRPGEVGGSIASSNSPAGKGKIRLGDTNQKFLRDNERNLTDGEKGIILSRFENKPDEIKKLFHDDKEICISVEPGRAESYGRSIYIDENYINTEISDHELLHTATVTNDRLRNTIQNRYNPPYMFRHTERYGDDIWSAKSEQFVMVMNGYNRDRDTWIYNVKVIEHSNQQRTTDEAAAQVDAITNYLKGVRIW